MRVIQGEAPSDNTAFTHRGQAPQCIWQESLLTDNPNPARLNLQPRYAALHLSLSGSLMQERYRKSAKTLDEDK